MYHILFAFSDLDGPLVTSSPLATERKRKGRGMNINSIPVYHTCVSCKVWHLLQIVDLYYILDLITYSRPFMILDIRTF